MRIFARPLPSVLLIAALSGLLAACPERTSEQPGPDPFLEAEVDRFATALEGGPLATPGTAVVVALVDEGELRWARSFGRQADGQKLDPARVFAAPRLAPMLLAVGLERLVDQGKASLPDERRAELAAQPDDALAAALAAEIEKASGQSWRDYLRQEIVEPLAMTSTRLSEGPPPTLETSAEDLVKLMVDLQKSHAGRTWRRLEQKGAQRLLRAFGENGRGLGFELGGRGQAAHFFRHGEAAGQFFNFDAFISSGNGAVILGSTPETVAATRRVLAGNFDWPALTE